MELPKNAAEIAKKVKDGLEVKAPEIDVLVALQQAMKVPGAKIDREKFLRKELKRRHSNVIIERAIEHNPAYARIPREEIDKLAQHAIDYECGKATAISFTTGLPGGAVGVAAIPADIIQYFVFMLRVIQELAYLYGFDDFHLDEDDIDNETLNEIMVFLGVMFGVQQANAAIKVIANMAGKNVAKRLARKALTKGTIYPIVKKIATTIGYKMTKEVFAGGVGRMVPVLGGIVTGGLTYATFKPCANNLKNVLRKEPISDPEFYKSGEYLKQEVVIPDAEDVVYYSIDPEDDEPENNESDYPPPRVHKLTKSFAPLSAYPSFEDDIKLGVIVGVYFGDFQAFNRLKNNSRGFSAYAVGTNVVVIYPSVVAFFFQAIEILRLPIRIECQSLRKDFVQFFGVHLLVFLCQRVFGTKSGKPIKVSFRSGNVSGHWNCAFGIQVYKLSNTRCFRRRNQVFECGEFSVIDFLWFHRLCPLIKRPSTFPNPLGS